MVDILDNGIDTPTPNITLKKYKKSKNSDNDNSDTLFPPYY